MEIAESSCILINACTQHLVEIHTAAMVAKQPVFGEYKFHNDLAQPGQPPIVFVALKVTILELHTMCGCECLGQQRFIAEFVLHNVLRASQRVVVLHDLGTWGVARRQDRSAAACFPYFKAAAPLVTITTTAYSYSCRKPM